MTLIEIWGYAVLGMLTIIILLVIILLVQEILVDR